MTDLEIQEQAEKASIGSEHEIDFSNGFIECAKWMQEQDKWIEIKYKDDLPKIRCNCLFWDKSTNKPILGEFLNNSKDEINYILTNASHYLIVDLPFQTQ